MRRLRRLLAPAVIGAGLAASFAFPPAGAAPATGSTINVVVDSLAPLIPARGGDLRISGRVVNSSAQPIEQVAVRLRLSSQPLSDRDQLSDVANMPLIPSLAGPSDTAIEESRSGIDPVLRPGEESPFVITVPLADLPLGGAGTYVISVEALGTDPEGAQATLGIQRTFLPWFPKGTDLNPVGLTWLWPLADWPARDADGTLLNDSTPLSLAPGGRLADLVSVASLNPSVVTWIADPELLQAASDIANGYQVLRDGELIVGDRSDDARSWLAALKSAVRSSLLHALPYADIDASAARRAGLQQDVVRAITRSPNIAARAIEEPVEGGIAWAPSGRIDKRTANLLAEAGVTTIVLAAEAMTPVFSTADPVLPAQTPNGIADYSTGVGLIDAVLLDSGLTSALGSRQRTRGEIVLARQRFLAETALIATEPGAKPDRVIAAGPAEIRWHPTAELLNSLLRATSQAPWLRPTTIEELRAAPRVPRTKATYGTGVVAAEISAQYMGRVRAAEGRLDRLVAILDDPSTVGPAYAAALLRAQSSAWRAEPSVGAELLASINAGLLARTSSVRVLSSGTVIFSGDAGRVPVTIANDGEQAVNVGLALIGQPSARLESVPLAGIRVDPGKKVSVDLEARVVGGEPLTVEVQLLTPSGARYGSPATISLVSTAYSRAAGWVVAAAFAALAAFVVIGITRRIRRSRSWRSPSDPGTADS
ncbi:MAG: hypothetical protein F2840_03880 [Actinobacteria bacterium]|uniref:Unannotated protein n=1 Tax=freshwater metagenome TaxID=449393 RepID=A0A6J7J6R4_9ZZZZ|nr:hypothetical protein [Actinomycetota bacterium]